MSTADINHYHIIEIMLGQICGVVTLSIIYVFRNQLKKKCDSALSYILSDSKNSLIGNPKVKFDIVTIDVDFDTTNKISSLDYLPLLIVPGSVFIITKIEKSVRDFVDGSGAPQRKGKISLIGYWYNLDGGL